ncbi:MAG: o-succinylbenzoate---CoA ligase [Streptosporangiaceae bacterium]|jgi:O-succinylbenzoic acid--CoA ligase|nr:o-succinylbenzoate---CoA ligase [Streptosporangiaceae bacterium]
MELLAAALDGSGPAVLPVDPDLPPARLAALLEALAPATVETPQGTQRMPGSPSATRGLGGAPAPLGQDTAVVIATSGSTGEPKGVELSAAALVCSARASLDRIGARAGDTWLSCLPPSHIAGLQVFIRSLLAGTAPVVRERLDGAVAAAAGCQFISVVPTQLRRLARGPDARAALSGFRAILLGGAAVQPALLEAARSAGGKVTTTYGMTETCGGCVYDGVPLDGVSVEVGAADRIRIAGPVLFSGYRGRPDLTGQAMDGRWFVTSDVGELGPSGRLAVLGRADGMINTGGEKVAADEVAAALEASPGVREAAVTGQPDAEWGEIVTAIVVPADPSAPPVLADLRAQLRGRLPDSALPRALVLVAALPLLPSGKPDLLALRALARSGA